MTFIVQQSAATQLAWKSIAVCLNWLKFNVSLLWLGVEMLYSVVLITGKNLISKYDLPVDEVA